MNRLQEHKLSTACYNSQHDKCLYEECECECHQTSSPTAAPDTTPGEWSVFKYHKRRVLDQPDGVSGCVVAETQTEEQAERIVRDHNAVAGLVGALTTLRGRVSDGSDFANVIDAALTKVRR
jgi:hypothetical protein